jgi:hypothetical protein
MGKRGAGGAGAAEGSDDEITFPRRDPKKQRLQFRSDLADLRKRFDVVGEDEFGPLECSICMQTFQEPVTLPCKHTFCLDCYSAHAKVRKDTWAKRECPLRCKILPPPKITEKHINIDLWEDACNKRYKCLSKGCSFVGTLKRAQTHLKECEYMEYECEEKGCKFSGTKEYLSIHRVDCVFKPRFCCHCGEIYVAAKFPEPHWPNLCPVAMVRCNDCTRHIMRKDMDSHRKSECEEMMIYCGTDFCGQSCMFKCKRKEMQYHKQNECKYRFVPCDKCRDQMAFCQLEEHKAHACREVQITCPNEGCETVYKRKFEKHHRERCMEEKILCPFEIAGCNFHDKRKNVREHEERNLAMHLRYMMLHQHRLLNNLRGNNLFGIPR